MSIPAVNVSYLTSAPVAGGSGILAFGGSSLLEFSYVGTATIVLDGTATSAVINYVDGSNALPWSPSACVVQRVGGNALNSIVSFASATNNIAATVTLSAAGTNTNTIQYAVFVLK